MAEEVMWTGSRTCDFCNNVIKDILIDGKTTYPGGPWATMCEKCHSKFGYPQFGIGIGQKYKKNDKDEFVKIEG